MSQFKAFENKTTDQPKHGFNLVTQHNNFSSVFDPVPLEGSESNLLESLLVDNYQPGIISDDQVCEDIESLKNLTAEIRAVAKQSIVLIGERVFKANQLLKSYKDGTFTKWLENTFGSRKTGYNALSYFNLYKELSSDLQNKFKKMPQKIGYILASRKGCDLEVKKEIVRDYHDMSHDDLVLLIQEKIPSDSKKTQNKKTSNERLISEIRANLKKLQKRKDCLSDDDKHNLSEIAEQISFLSGLVSV